MASVDKERDLGGLMSKDLKSSKQCLLEKNKTNLMLSIINRGVYKSTKVISRLYKAHMLDLI